MKEYIRKILEMGNQAPSGENCQPWKFKVNGDTVFIYLLSERDQSLYGWGQRASLIAHGAVLENMYIAAEHLGYDYETILFPKTYGENCIAKVTFNKKLIHNNHSLYNSILVRATNRKPYKIDVVNKDVLDELKSCANEVEYGTVAFIDNTEQKNKLALIGSINEEIMLNNEYLHNFFFNHVNWTKKEDDQKKVGFYIQTLELPPPAQKFFKLISKWNLLRILNTLSFNKIIAKQNSNIYKSSAVIGGIIIDGDSEKDYLMAGRVIERLWLKATKHGLSMQPLTGVLFFMLQIKAGNTDKFTKKQITKITQAYSDIEKIFNASGKTIPFMFRMGYAEKPTARSSRFSIDDITEIINV